MADGAALLKCRLVNDAPSCPGRQFRSGIPGRCSPHRSWAIPATSQACGLWQSVQSPAAPGCCTFADSISLALSSWQLTHSDFASAWVKNYFSVFRRGVAGVAHLVFKRIVLERLHQLWTARLVRIVAGHAIGGGKRLVLMRRLQLRVFRVVTVEAQRRSRLGEMEIESPSCRVLRSCAWCGRCRNPCRAPHDGCPCRECSGPV